MIGKKYYDLFGLSNDASEEDIKRRYRELVKKYHPDRNNSPESNSNFQKITEAYEGLLAIVKNPIHNTNQLNEKSIEDEWIKYRERARKITLEKQRKQNEEMNAWYNRLRTGIIWKYSCFIVGFSAIILIFLILDLFLPTRLEPEIVVGFSRKSYHSLDEHRISFVTTSSGKNYWLDRYNGVNFNLNPFIKIESSNIYHNPINFQKYDGTIKKIIPLQLSVYWSQFLIFLVLIIPIGFYFYKTRDVFFIMGSYFTRFFVSPFILWFLITNERWIHLFTLGYL